ncbi:efflux RND transporter periplasmic adaptor subunit [Amphritea opalescens]|uniref:Efflux RND transporter periplasmic adaptor subunit n=1 Tax=Amphritea opalescens TaxID=2490544 RepID=A0A430KTS8_9GAMM|nr:efflux RND transporter periplasmic adaptor subunit [Amphritea opalescens]RTE66723.1 efflux RND transporter periplasmic adaptor subunit [Amphritea opalescens]
MRPLIYFFICLGVFTPVMAESEQNDTLPALDCIISPSKSIDLSSSSPGVITEVLVKRGERVTKGQPIARLDDRVEFASVQLAKARAAIRSDLDGGLVNLNYDRLASTRVSEVFLTHAASSQDKEQAERAVKLSSASVKQAKEQAKIRGLELARAKAVLEQRLITSPIDGVVQRNLKYQGEYVDEDPVVRLVALNPLHIETMVPVQYFGKLTIGHTAEVYPEVDAQHARVARVIAIDPVGDVGSSAFGVQLEMDNPELTIPAGIKCDLKFADKVSEQLNEQDAAPLE